MTTPNRAWRPGDPIPVEPQPPNYAGEPVPFVIEGDEPPARTKDATIVWEERKHPRKGKGPGGGEFTRGGGGGGLVVHVHPPQKLSPAEAANKLLESPPRSEMAKRLAEQHNEERRKEIGGFLGALGAPQEMPAAGQPGRVQALIEKNREKHRAFEESVRGPKITLRAKGYNVMEVPADARGFVNADDTPPKDPARMDAGADGFDQAIGVLKAAGLGSLANNIKAKVGVTFSSLKQGGGPINFGSSLDTGTGMETVTDQFNNQFILINANSAPAQSFGIHDKSPAMGIEITNLAKAGTPPDKLARAEMRAAAVHEFGHVLDNWSQKTMTASLGVVLERELTPQYGENWARHAGQWIKDNISGYGATMPQEATAEVFYLMATRGVKALPPALQEWGQYWWDIAAGGHMPRPKAVMKEWEER